MSMELMREVFGEVLLQLGKRDRRIVVLDADMGRSTRASRFCEQFPERFFQMGVAEQNMVGVASGLASVGFIPFVVSFAAFIKRALDQVRVQIAQPSLNAKIVGAYSGFSSSRSGKSHHAIQDMAIMRSMPNMWVVSPVDILELKAVMEASVEHIGPVYLRLIRGPSPVVTTEEASFRVGKGMVLREGKDVAIISTGIETVRALEAARILESKGIGVYLLHLPWIKPLDKEAVIEAASVTGAVVVAEEHNFIGGLGSAVAEVLGEKLPTLMKRVGIPDAYGESASEDELAVGGEIGTSNVVSAVYRVLEKRDKKDRYFLKASRIHSARGANAKI